MPFVRRKRLGQIDDLYQAIRVSWQARGDRGSAGEAAGIVEALNQLADAGKAETPETGGAQDRLRLARHLGRLAVHHRDKGDLDRSNGVALVSLAVESATLPGDRAAAMRAEIERSVRDVLSGHPGTVDAEGRFGGPDRLETLLR